jgi:hypothetical protein
MNNERRGNEIGLPELVKETVNVTKELFVRRLRMVEPKSNQSNGL